MAIHSIPNISINGSNKLFGGFFYKISYQQGFFSDPSRMTVSLINDDGRYGKPNIGYSQKYHISIGNQSFLMFAISFRMVENTAGNTLEIDFVDNSQLLGKFVVGLSGKQGYIDAKDTPPCLILLGTEIDPCGQEEPPFTQELINDPFAISVINDGVDRIIDCETFRANNILEVDYSFAELIKGMNGAGITSSGFSDKAPEYRNKYIGNLRDVLNNWCADYGFSYFFNGAGELVFIDVSAGISIDFTAPDNDSLLGKITEKTVEGTVARGVISYFGVEGQQRCNFGTLTEKGKIIDYKRLLNCAPVNISNIFPYGINGVEGTDLGLAAILSKFSPSLRASYFLYTKRGLQNYLSSDYPNYPIPEYGNFHVINSYSSTSAGSFKTVFDSMFANLPNKASLDRSRVKFVYAYWDAGLAEQQYSFENSLADDFLGHWWYADYGQTAIHARPGPPDIITADGANANYYNTPDVYIPIGSEKYLVPLNLNRFILVERNTSWYPNDASSQLESYWQTFVPGTNATIGPDIIDAVNSNAAAAPRVARDANQLQMFTIILPPSTNIAQTSETHPLENNPTSSAENGGQGINYVFGLMDKTTAAINVEGTNLIAPVGSLFGFNGQYKIIIDEGLGIVNKCFSTSKIESIVTNIDCSKDHERLDVALLDDTYLNFKDLYKCDESGCTFNDKILKKYKLAYSTPKEFEKITYSIGGLANMPSPDQGLLEFNINIDAEGGITTDLVVGNTAATPPSTDYSIAQSMFATNHGRGQYAKPFNYS